MLKELLEKYNLIDRTNLESFLNDLEDDGQDAILYFQKDPSEDVLVKFIKKVPLSFDCMKELRTNKKAEAVLLYNGSKGEVVTFCSNNDLTFGDYLKFPELFFKEY